ncbi:hypothetical protein BDP27DRAFT_282122 [Rhodocollybia butyracea]|uniref:Uncharacterized protein n=1 Tax=Rhodocollybia butyracea TaxID=206335 RepID=A0A9P5Q2N9_9AGAR|nr:hypothetical protein BDP27DRAFT_282122 [Rhodocollybia butyracea]
MGQHFLCCLPIRLGAFVVSLYTLVVSGLQAASYIVAINDLRKVGMDVPVGTSKSVTTGAEAIAALIVISDICLLLSALFGLFGVLSRRIGWIKTFNNFLKTLLFLHFFTGIALIILLAKDKESWCTNSDSNSCIGVPGKVSKGVAIVIIAVILGFFLLLEAYGVWIVSDCIKYLKTREARLHPFATASVGEGAPVGEDTVPLTNGKSFYGQA